MIRILSAIIPKLHWIASSLVEVFCDGEGVEAFRTHVACPRKQEGCKPFSHWLKSS